MKARFARVTAVLACALTLSCFTAGEIQARQSGWVTAPQTVDPALKKAASGRSKSAKNRKTPAPATEEPKLDKTVYENQAPVTEAELNHFIELLPQFRAWARQNNEDAHPIVDGNNKPDFTFSANAAQWVSQRGIQPRRFFCIMGRTAAGLVIVEEGNDFKGTRPADMPPVADSELELVRKHLGEILKAGGPGQPIK